jgi:putative ABC transport system permease protein
LVRLFGLFHRKRREQEFAEELASHLAFHIEDNLRAGMSPEEARRQALIKLGGVTLTKERAREQGGLPMLETLIQDLRFGLRMLRRHKSFTAITVLMLALGIGATTAAFSVVDAWLLRPLPFKEPERLIAVWEAETKSPHIPAVFAAWRHYEEWARQAQSLESVAGYYWWGVALTEKGGEIRLMGQVVTPNFFATLGVAPLHGRTFRAEDLQGPPVVMLGHGCWQRQFGGALDALGQTVTLNDKSYTVIGIAPPGHSLPSIAQPDRAEDVWLLFKPDEPLPHPKSYREEPEGPIGVVARLKPGFTIAQVKEELEGIKTRSDVEHGSEYTRFTTFVANLQQDATRSVRPTLLTIAGAALFVWLIVCANVAGLLLARLAERRKELAIRSALGAGRARVVRQTLTESLLLALLGSVFGVLSAQAMLRGFLALDPFEIPAFNEIAINRRVLLFAVLLACLTAVVFGLVPALQAGRQKINALLNDSSRGSSASQGARRARNTLVVAEVALSLMLLVGAGLMTRSLARLATEPLGYSADQILTLDIHLPAKAYPDIQQRIGFYDRLLERVRALGGVQFAGASTRIPIHSGGSGNVFMIEGQPAANPGDYPIATGAIISEDYLTAVSIPLRTGRAFAASDHAQTDPVALINETLARRYFPNADPLGKRIRRGDAKSDSPWRAIVGVVGDTKGLAYGKLGWRTEAMIYEPLRQASSEAFRYGAHLFVRPAANTSLSAAVLSDAVKAIDPRAPAPELKPLSDHVARELRQPRLQMLLSSSLALMALLLAVLGLYGVISYAVLQRTQEIGIRMALGAQMRDVLRLALGQGMKLTLCGVGLGLVGALVVTRLLQTSLYGVSATDPLTFVGITVLLMGAALIACAIPARRATKVDPLVALRHD